MGGDGQGAPDVIFVGDGSAENAVEITALVTDRDVDEEAAIAGEETLNPADKGAEFLPGEVIAIVIDASEFEEDGDGGTEFGEEFALAGGEAVEHRGEEPGLDLGGGQFWEWHAIGVMDWAMDALDDGESVAGSGIDAPLGNLEERFQSGSGDDVDDELALAGQSSGAGHSLQGFACEDVQGLDFAVADDKASCRADSHGRLDCEADDTVVEDLHPGELRHEPLHAETRGDGVAAVVVVEPACDGIAGKGDDASSEPVNLLDERGIDSIEVDGELFDAAAGAEGGSEGLGERGEA